MKYLLIVLCIVSAIACQSSKDIAIVDNGLEQAKKERQCTLLYEKGTDGSRYYPPFVSYVNIKESATPISEDEKAIQQAFLKQNGFPTAFTYEVWLSQTTSDDALALYREKYIELANHPYHKYFVQSGAYILLAKQNLINKANAADLFFLLNALVVSNYKGITLLSDGFDRMEKLGMGAQAQNLKRLVIVYYSPEEDTKLLKELEAKTESGDKSNAFVNEKVMGVLKENISSYINLKEGLKS